MGLVVEVLLIVGVIVITHYVFSTVVKRRTNKNDGGFSDEVEIERLRLVAKDKAESREMYERLYKEKLDVIKTAITMGYDELELSKLDKRLENLVGKDKLDELLSSDLSDSAGSRQKSESTGAQRDQ